MKKYCSLLKQPLGWLATTPFEQGSVTDVVYIYIFFCLELQASLFGSFTNLNSPLEKFLLRDTQLHCNWKLDLTLMTNLGKIFIFSNLITIPVQGCRFWIVLLGTSHREVLMYWGLIKISKETRMSKEIRRRWIYTPLSTIWLWGLRDFVKTNLKYIFQDKSYQVLVKLSRNLGYNDNLKPKTYFSLLHEMYGATVL